MNVIKSRQGLVEVAVLELLGEAFADEGLEEDGRKGARLCGKLADLFDEEGLEGLGVGVGVVGVEGIDGPKRKNVLVVIVMSEDVLQKPVYSYVSWLHSG